MAAKYLLFLILNDEFLSKVAPVPRAGCLLYSSNSPVSAWHKPAQPASRDSAKARKNCLSLREECFSHNAISYPAEPFSTAFQDNEVGRKTAVTSFLDGEGLVSWG